MHGKGIIWQVPAAILAAMLLLMGVQISPAHAKFNDTETAAMAVSEARIPAPAANTVPVTKSCEVGPGQNQRRQFPGSYLRELPRTENHRPGRRRTVHR